LKALTSVTLNKIYITDKIYMPIVYAYVEPVVVLGGRGDREAIIVPLNTEVSPPPNTPPHGRFFIYNKAKL